MSIKVCKDVKIICNTAKLILLTGIKYGEDYSSAGYEESSDPVKVCKYGFSPKQEHTGQIVADHF